MRKQLLWQNTVMITISFLAGVAFYQLFTLDQAMTVISLFDARILLEEMPSIQKTIVPLAISVIVVVLFATHPYFFVIGKIAIALKMCFVGFSSVYLLAQRDELLAYGVWWFPFQFLYIVLLLLLCERLSGQRNMKKKGQFPIRQVIVIFICLGLLVAAEIFVISTIFK